MQASKTALVADIHADSTCDSDEPSLGEGMNCTDWHLEHIRQHQNKSLQYGRKSTSPNYNGATWSVTETGAVLKRPLEQDLILNLPCELGFSQQGASHTLPHSCDKRWYELHNLAKHLLKLEDGKVPDFLR
jgi:hypothetical protein